MYTHTHHNVKEEHTKYSKSNTVVLLLHIYLDQQKLDVEIDQLRDELKPKVSKLHKMEGMAETVLVIVHFFDLNPYTLTHTHTGRAEAIGFDLKGMRLEEELTRQK